MSEPSTGTAGMPAATGMPPAPGTPPAGVRPAAGSRTLDPGDRTDAELLAAHCAGDPDAFGELFRRHRDRMWAVAMRTCGDREIAADAVQDGFLAAFRRADSFRGDAAVTTWLHRIVVNACLDRLRRRRPTSPLPEYESLDFADRRDDHGQHRVGASTSGPRSPDFPRGSDSRSSSSTCTASASPRRPRVLGVAEGTVKSRCARGRAALAELLGIAGERPTGRRTRSVRPRREPSAVPRRLTSGEPLPEPP